MPGDIKFVFATAMGNIAQQPNATLEVDDPTLVRDRVRESLVTIMTGMKNVEFTARYPALHPGLRKGAPGKRCFLLRLIPLIHLHGVVGRGGTKPPPSGAVATILKASRVRKDFSSIYAEVKAECIGVAMACAMRPLRPGIYDELFTARVHHHVHTAVAKGRRPAAGRLVGNPLE